MPLTSGVTMRRARRRTRLRAISTNAPARHTPKTTARAARALAPAPSAVVVAAMIGARNAKLVP